MRTSTGLHSFKINALAAALALAAGSGHADIYISEYIEGNSNNKAIELYNSSDTAVNLSGYSLQYFFNGGVSAGLTIPLSGSIAAKGVFVVAQASSVAAILGKANLTNGSSWYNGDDAITLRNGSTVIDSIGQIGVDPGTEWGTGLVSTADNTLRRKGTVTTGDANATDVFNPAAEWDGFATDSFDDLGLYAGSGGGTGGGPSAGACGDPATAIGAIQGSGASSALVGSTVGSEGIVTASFQGAGQLGGFFMQQADGNPATSDGIFVASTTPVSVGDSVRATGAVAETFGLTQLAATTVSVCASGNSLPAAVAVNLPLGSVNAPESLEGMRVTLPQTLSVTETFELGRFGQLLLANGRLQQPTHIALPGAPAQAVAAQNALNQILLDDGSNLQNPDPEIFPAPGLSATNTVRSGDTVSGITGILSYDFGAWRVLPTTAPAFVHSNTRPAAPVLPTTSNLKVAGFNVLNFFNGNGLGGGFPTARGANNAIEFGRQKAKIVNALKDLDADVIGLTELENDGYGPYSAIAELTAALNSATGSTAWHYIDPGLSQIGTDAIAVGFIYRNDRAAPLGTSAILDSSVNPQFIDTKNRPALAQTFRAVTGRGVVTLAVNHLKSKGSDCLDVADPDTGDGQGNCSHTRTLAAQALVSWLATDPTHSNDRDFMIIGDLNAYAKEDPISALVSGGYTDLMAKYHGSSAYSYVFDGQTGYLDHALTTAGLTAQTVAAEEWHINADEPTALDYNTEFKSAGQVSSFYSSDAYRSSDHDPLVIGLKLVIDLDGDGDVDQNDVNIVLAARNLPAGINDQRDVNGDGVINTSDARALTLQCTRARCATN